MILRELLVELRALNVNLTELLTAFRRDREDGGAEDLRCTHDDVDDHSTMGMMPMTLVQCRRCKQVIDRSRKL